MTRSVGIIRNFALLGLLGGVLALPLRAEEITVTVPPDDPPAQAVAQPAAAPPQALPSFAAGETLKKPAASTADDAAQATAGAAPATDTTKHKAKVKKTAETATTPGATTGGAPAAAKTPPADGTVKPADKPKQTAKVSPCKDLEESACGANKLCSWVVPAPDAAGKVGKAKCRSLAALKKEAAAKAAKGGKPEVLPWAPKTTENPPPAASTDGSAATPATTPAKTPAKTKTAAVKKPTKPKEIAPPVPTGSVGTQEASPPAAPAATSDAPAPDPQ